MSRRALQHKSTNVRYTVISRALRTLARISPSLAARALEKLFLATRRHEVPQREMEWLEGATRSSFESRGRSLPAWHWGSGPTVLLVHGWEGRGSQLGAFVAPLTAAGYRVVLFDAPGHGQAGGRESSLVEMADAIRDAAEDYGPLEAVVAHSAGAAATTIAMSHELGPARVVFVAPPADLGAFLQKVTAQLKLPAELAHRTRRRIEQRFDVDWDALRTERLASEMTSPLLIIHDRDDREVRFENGERLSRAWPDATLIPTSGLGHRRVLRDPAVVAQTVHFVCERHASFAAGAGSGSTSASTTRFLPPSLAR